MSQLCSRCDELFIAAFDVVTAPLTDGDSGEPLAYEDLPNGVFGRKFWLWEEWQSSAIYGLCHFCHLLYKARWMENAPRPLEELYYDIERIAKHDSPGGQWDEAILRLWTKRTMKERHAWDEQTQHRVTFRIAQPHTRSCRPNIWSKETLRHLQTWLSTCETSSHGHCERARNQSQFEGPRRLPRRLLDLDPDGTISESPFSDVDDIHRFSAEAYPKIRLCETGFLKEDTDYVTLSHRWPHDGSPDLILDFDSLTLFTVRIPYSVLSKPGCKTFRDAIEVTRCLGYRYLWIDSVCINQEDEAEKEVEISHMNTIYSNGTMNLSASGASGGADGLFLEPTTCHKIFHNRQGHRMDLVTSYQLDANRLINESPLLRRGWVFQERMLAPRVIHFTLEAVCWECFTDVLNSPGICSSSVHAFKTNFGEARGRDGGGLGWQWSSVVEQYSRLDLTFIRDRLPAISAVARDFAPGSGAYLAGLWEEGLEKQLTWRVKPEREGRRPAGKQRYLAPSWSWASAGNGVYWDDMLDDFHRPFSFFQIESVSVTPTGGDLFGQVSAGSLRLRAHQLCRVEWYAAEKRLDAHVDIDHGRVVHQAVGGCFEIFWDWHELRDAHKPSGVSIPLPDGDEIWVAGSTFWLLLTHYEHYSESNVSGLMLHRTEKLGQYVRVGAFSYRMWEAEEHNSLAELLNGWGETKQVQRVDDYLFQDGDGEYSIEIV